MIGKRGQARVALSTFTPDLSRIDAYAAAAGALMGVHERHRHAPRLRSPIGALHVDAARDEVSRFVRDPSGLIIWSREFFLQIIERIETV